MIRYTTISGISLNKLAFELNEFTINNQLTSYKVLHIDKNPLIGYEALLEIRKTEDIGGW